MSGYPFALGLCVFTLAVVVQLLRKRRLREKYAAIWLVLASLIAVLGLFPDLLVDLADAVGVQTPTNLLFAGGLVVLLLVCIQLSTEVSGLEEETRTLAEEIALQERRLEQLEHIAHLEGVADLAEVAQLTEVPELDQLGHEAIVGTAEPEPQDRAS